MRTETFICDICKQSKSKEDLAKIKVSTEGIKIKGSDYWGLQIDICPDCLKKKGFVVESKPEIREQVDAQNKKTLEDKIYEILEDMGVTFTEQEEPPIEKKTQR